MGYRSDVAIRIETVNGLNVETVIDELKERLANKDLADALDANDITISPDKDIATLYFGDVKWYDNYEDVRIIMDWFNDMENLANDWIEGICEDDTPTVSAAQYICIGEDITDIEERAYGEINDPMYISRTIEM